MLLCRQRKPKLFQRGATADHTPAVDFDLCIERKIKKRKDYQEQDVGRTYDEDAKGCPPPPNSDLFKNFLFLRIIANFAV